MQKNKLATSLKVNLPLL